MHNEKEISLETSFEVVQKVLSTIEVNSRVVENQRFLRLNLVEIAFRPTFWTASKGNADSLSVELVSKNSPKSLRAERSNLFLAYVLADDQGGDCFVAERRSSQ